MENKKTLEEIRKIFENDRFATENGAIIDEIGEKSAVCYRVDVSDDLGNLTATVMVTGYHVG